MSTHADSIILHHYSSSPYSEKLRAILGFKGVPWLSVTTPAILPKPDLMPLTGGYRRAPILQVGRDVYCDTRLAVRVLERLAPTPPLVPPAFKASIAAFIELEQTLFFGAVASNFQPAGLKAMIDRMGPEMMDAFVKDRSVFFVGGSAKRPGPEYSKLHFVPALNALDAQLATSRFVLGDAPTLADFIAYHPIWFVKANAGVRSMLEPFHNVTAWFDRIKSIGHGQHTDLPAEEALNIARSTTTGQPFDGPLLEVHGLAVGQRVKINATDYGVDAVEGVLVHASVFEFAIKREDPRAGEVIVHFPRSGFAISAA